ncbi:MAG: COG0553: Superfamily II DNA/RNA helicases, SNF2 family [uncultured Thiotrichaceae bacterium]|uniref:COG0553: Superfamily II DNA/RNA helicases, SNF2 family n=1 Tax=uncultured Thiotrichaceae bacterium TaxID=298394 RepID=A0A6S6U6U3_9GAMM|nr:MAG: COG0553: Superfamily II DNA/RNA helicases, SNF2 family [uncultured Thiotrichaceae bacterium]
MTDDAAQSTLCRLLLLPWWISVFDKNKFNELAIQHRSLIELLSIIYVPVAATPLVQCINKAEILNPENDLAWTTRSVKLCMNDLHEMGLVNIHNNLFSCADDTVDEITFNAIDEDRFRHLSETVQSVFPAKKAFSGKRIWTSWESAIADVRICLYQGDYLSIKPMLDDIQSQFQYLREGSTYPFPDIFGPQISQRHLNYLPDEVITLSIAPFYLAYATLELDNIDELWAEMQRRQESITDENQRNILNTLIAEQSLVRSETEFFPNKPDNNYYSSLWNNAKSFQQLTHKKPDDALETYETGLRLLRKATKKPHDAYFADTFEVFHFLHLLATNQPDAINKTIRAHTALHEQFVSYYLLVAYADLISGGNENELKDEIELLPYETDAFIALMILLIAYWSGIKVEDNWLVTAKNMQKKARNNGYAWFASEFSTALGLLLNNTDVDKTDYQKYGEKTHKQYGTTTLFQLVNPQHGWERSLNALSVFAETTKPKEKTTDRIIWVIDENADLGWNIAPKLQKQTKSGGWSKGRSISVKQMYAEQLTSDLLSTEDMKVCEAIRSLKTYHFYSNEFSIPLESLWSSLTKHPRVFWDKSRSTPVDILQGEVELLVTEEGSEIRVSLYPDIHHHGTLQSQVAIVKETPTRLRFYNITEQHEQLLNILGNGLLVPLDEEEKLRSTLLSLAPMLNIQSDISGVDNATEVEPNNTLHVHLLPYADGLRMSMRVQPFATDDTPMYPPGEGRQKILIEIDGKKVKTKRDLDTEKTFAEHLVDNINVFADWDNFADEFILESPEEALEGLSGLHELGDAIVLEWPEGEVMRINASLSPHNMRININEKGKWFELDGEVQVSDNLIISLGQLLEMSRNSKGRFLKMGEGQYLSLTNNLRKKLHALESYSEQIDGKTHIDGLASLALEDFLDEVDLLEGDGKWQEHVQRLKNIQDEAHILPTNLDADLRDYQVEGFNWISRLAKWGVGACLADDMGLGKTIQSLAFILTQAHKGPCLVIAPVSVCNNWHSETEKFASSLNPIFYRGKDRIALLESLKPHDVLICSYGLLPQDADQLTAIHWNMVILDEAQAIKNIGTKRTQAAWGLNADFRLITTGTPIENHLGELWSLFRFLNPGLLGTQEHFMRQYMSPIERYKDQNASYSLRRIIQPFILRRTKSQVLKELPPRTEITYSVPLSTEERALYEAVRQKAMAKFEKKEQNPNAKGADHIEILAEITRLRLASCHPKLIMPNTPLPGSKLQAFGVILEELLDNNHKALVFSQFVKHLAILREYLDEKGIKYQYLDGSTPQTRRKKAVDDFQDGSGDVFLISLKAGGSGLNLTEADYVIHMDPWWNPAVEDQASDRAHRIGQQRPVTIYRLVAENTIEEKIVNLHRHKRDLADNLLQGSEVSGKMSTTEMLQLIRGN